MGATGWKYFVPYRSDTSAALQRLRENVFFKGQYLSGVTVAKTDFKAALMACGSNLESVLKSFAARASDPNLPIQVREKFAALVKQYGEFGQSESTSVPRPKTIDELLQTQSESGTHSILDITHVAPSPAFGAVCPLTATRLVKIFGSAMPSHADIESKYEEGALEEFVRQRWQGIYIIVYRCGSPDEIFFAGCSGD